MKHKITGIVWFTGLQSIGIITTIDPMGKIKARIGYCQKLSTSDCIDYIRKNGAKFPIAEAEQLIKEFGQPLDIEY